MKKDNFQKQSIFSSTLLIVLIIAISIIFDLNIKNSSLFLPLLISICITSVIAKWSIKVLKRIKVTQNIRKEGPKNHQEKSGTPTMGGVFVIPIGLIIGNLFHGNNDLQIIGISIVTICYMLIGVYDDWYSLIAKKNRGLTVKQKLTAQLCIAVIFIYWGLNNQLIQTNIDLLFNETIELGILFLPLGLFILIAESNATNLTDGLDGLASGCGAIVFTGLAVELMLRGDSNNFGIASFCMAQSGSWLGFLLHNKKPAKIFMGDTGSLAMGASLASIALISNTIWSLFIMGGIFLIESLSVLIQVGGFKLTKKLYGEGFRIFLMAPLHHHYELQGKPEIDIVNKFWLISIIFVLIGLLLRTNY